MVRELKYVGKNIPLHDISAKVTGNITYLGDQIYDGMLYGKLLLSPIPNGIVKQINTSKAEQLPGVVKIFTYWNSPQVPYNSCVWFRGEEAPKNELLFTNRVRFVGDRVAGVVAKSEEIANKAIELIEVEYEELPFCLSPDQTNEYPHFEDQPNTYEKKLSCGDVEAVFDRAEQIFTDKIETQRIHHGAMEPHVCIAVPEAMGGVTVHSPCQILFSVRHLVAEILNLPYHRVRVIKAPMGGSFGGKQEVILEPICALMALRTGCPVRLELDRKESVIATRTRYATQGVVKTAVDRDGKFLAREITVTVDAGAYTTGGLKVGMAMGKKAFRLYRIPYQRYQCKIVHTNTLIGGATRGYGSPQIHAITEIQIDHIARQMKIDPVELRLKNLVHPYDQDPSGGPGLGNARIIEAVIKGRDAFQWDERRAACTLEGRYRRGVGMACGTHGNGYFGAYQDFVTMNLRMLEDGTVILNSGLHELGCGTITTITQIIAEGLDLSPDLIIVPEGDTQVSPYDIGSQASRVTYVCGTCAMELAEKLKEIFIIHSARIFGCSPERIALRDGRVWDTENPETEVSYGEMAAKIQRFHQVELYCTHTYKAPANPASFGAHFAQVKVDLFTGLVKVEKYLAVHDIGKAINPAFVEGQIQGGVQMGMGLALCEEITFDDKGVPRNTNFSKYHMVNAPDMPDVEVLLVEEGEEHGPYGAKSVGEIATVPVAPAIVNAVNHALGTYLTSLPLTPAKIISACHLPHSK